MIAGKRFFTLALVGLVLACWTSGLWGDVRRESTTEVDLKGALGTMMAMMGAKGPTRSIEYYRGNQFRSDTMDKKGRMAHSQMIDVEQELFVNIDHQKKEYTQMTFEQWRAMMSAHLQEADQGESQEDTLEQKWSFQVDVSTPGEVMEIAGRSAEKVIITMRIESQEEGGGKMIVTSTNWLCRSCDGADEMQRFHQRLAEKLGLMPGQGGMGDALSSALQGQQQLTAAMEKLKEESDKLSGVPLRVNVVYQSQGPADQGAAKSESEEPVPSSVSGLLKGFGKKAVASKKDDSQPNVLMEMDTEVVRYEVAPLEANLFRIPDGYTLRENDEK